MLAVRTRYVSKPRAEQRTALFARGYYRGVRSRISGGPPGPRSREAARGSDTVAGASVIYVYLFFFRERDFPNPQQSRSRDVKPDIETAHRRPPAPRGVRHTRATLSTIVCARTTDEAARSHLYFSSRGVAESSRHT
jgi:hypothetical protein